MTEKASQNKKIFELTEVLDEPGGLGQKAKEAKNGQQIVVIDGRGYERVRPDGVTIHELTDVIEERPRNVLTDDQIAKRTEEIVERIARELIPAIAERVIKEEIEKLKNPQAVSKSNQD